jgi:predicted TIM-barrel fold metal-dependent hydrolase
MTNSASRTGSNRAEPAQVTPSNLQFVDAHQHFWDLGRNSYPWLQARDPIPFRYGDYSALRRNYLPDDFAEDTRACPPAVSVHIEAEWDRATSIRETRWLEDLQATTGWPSACVAHVALDGDDVESELAEQSSSPLVRGIRHKPTSSTSPSDAARNRPGSMDDERWRRGYAILERHGLSFDLQAPWWDLEAATDLAADFPGIQIIVNHAGLPVDRSAEGLASWRRSLDRLASRPNIALKISGLGQRGMPWTVEANVPVIRDAIRIFGVARGLFASNYPVDSLVAPYQTILSGFLAAIADYPQREQQLMLHDNAVRLYRL